MFEWSKSVHYRWSYILFSPECKESTSMLDPLLYRWGVPPVVIRCVHWTMQMWVLQTSITAQGPAIVMIPSTTEAFSISATIKDVPAAWPHFIRLITLITSFHGVDLCEGVWVPVELYIWEALIPLFPGSLLRPVVQGQLSSVIADRFFKSAGTNSIFCGGCSSWVHTECNHYPWPSKVISQLQV